MLNDHTKEAITGYCYDWAADKISKDFTFRQHQLECIVDIISNILNRHYQNYIIEAPTGSGKSLINIIAAGVLSDYYNITSYILVSDLFLWEQYESFLKKHKRTGIVCLKGQTGNYRCLINDEDIKNADCRMSGISWGALFNYGTQKKLGYTCASRCPYVKARKKAIQSKVCVMTYQLFLFVMNNQMYNKDQNGAPIFAPHDVLFCDECHNIPDIVQTQYSPVVNLEDFIRLQALYNYKDAYQHDLFATPVNPIEDIMLYKIYKNWEQLNSKLMEIWVKWNMEDIEARDNMVAASEYLDLLEAFNDIVENIKADVQESKAASTLSKEEVAMFKVCSWYDNYMCHWHDFMTAMRNSGEKYFLKDITTANGGDQQKLTDTYVSFKCTKEDYITWYFLLKHAQYKVMTSATVGDKEAFDERMGFSYETAKHWLAESVTPEMSYMVTLPQIFDYSASPIYFLNRFKMSYKERDSSFESLKPAIYSICSTKFGKEKGIIQTGSYEFAKRLYDSAPQKIKERMLLYNGSREKMTVVKIHKLSQDTILVGPTLNTGVDLPGDDCRFIIILKVPYPNLKDKLVEARNKLYPLWYNSHTSNEIIQGIGRGVRYNGDWCVTYILDALFNNLYHITKHQYPKELQERIKYI